MMNGGSKKLGKRNLSVSGNDLEEYFLEMQEGTAEQDDVSVRADIDAAQRHEEVRRLRAYVAHLAEKVEARIATRQEDYAAASGVGDKLSAKTGLPTLLVLGIAAAGMAFLIKKL